LKSFSPEVAASLAGLFSTDGRGGLVPFDVCLLNYKQFVILSVSEGSVFLRRQQRGTLKTSVLVFRKRKQILPLLSTQGQDDNA
jgi:hypothetical protein